MKKRFLEQLEAKARKARKKANMLRAKAKKAEKKVNQLYLKAELYAKAEETAVDAEIIKALRKWNCRPNRNYEWKDIPGILAAGVKLNCKEAKADAEIIKALREWHDSLPPAKSFAWEDFPRRLLREMTLDNPEANGNMYRSSSYESRRHDEPSCIQPREGSGQL